MSDVYGPPSPQKPEPAWNDLRRALTKQVPKSLNNSRRGILKMRARRRRG